MSGVKIARRKVEGLVGDMPAVDAANLVLSQRLASVETLLPMAALQAHEDDEYVHQLRVASRRADASLRIFQPFLKKRAFRNTRRRLRKIRRAAGEARACDVMQQMLLGLRAAGSDKHGVERVAALDVLLDRTRQQRNAAQVAIHAVAKKYPPLKLARTRTKLLGSLRTVHLDHQGESELAMTFRALAKARLDDLAQPARRRAATSFDTPTRIEELHDLRILAKRLRYAMEIFAPCYADGLKSEYSRIESLQEALGNINDMQDLADWLTSELANSAKLADDTGKPILSLEQHASIDALVRELEVERDARATRFVRELEDGKWSDVFDLGKESQDKNVEIETRAASRAAEVSG